MLELQIVFSDPPKNLVSALDMHVHKMSKDNFSSVFQSRFMTEKWNVKLSSFSFSSVTSDIENFLHEDIWNLNKPITLINP